MKMFDYAMFIRILEIGVSPLSNKTLYVFNNMNTKKSFMKKQNKLDDKLIYTIREIWHEDALVNRRYKRYILVK